MSRAWFALGLVGFLTLVRATSAAAQRPGDISGYVIDAATHDRIAGATVHLAPSSVRATTDANGRFEMRLVPAGSYQLRVMRIGYAELTRRIGINDAQRVEVQLELSLDPVALQSVEASAARRVGELSITQSELASAHGKSAADVLGRLPGVVVVSTPGRQTISIRGSTPEAVLVLLDGVPLNDALGGTADLSTIPATLLQAVHVLPGAQSARYGPRAEAGVVLLTTRADVTAPSVALGVAQLGGRQGKAEIGGGRGLPWTAIADVHRRSGAFDFTLPPEVGGGAGRRANSDLRSVNGAISIASESEHSTGRVTIGGEHLERGLPGKGFAQSLFARQRMSRVRASVNGTRRIAHSSLDVAASIARQTTNIRDPAPPFGLPYDDDARATHGDITAQLTVPIARSAVRELHTVASVQTEHVNATTLRGSAPASYTFLGAAAGVQLGPRKRGGDISLAADARVDYDAVRTSLLPSHSLDLGYGRGTFRVHVAQRSSFSPATLSDLFFRESVGVESNPELRPERVPFELEAGASFDTRTRGIFLRSSIAAYHADVRDLIVWVPDFRFVWSPQNENVRRVGGEVSLQLYALNERLQLSASHSLVHLTYDRSGPSAQVAYRPRNSSRVAARYEHHDWRAEIESRFIGTRNTAPTNDNPLPGFWSTNADVARTWRAGAWTAQTSVAIARLFNEQGALIFGYPGAGPRYELRAQGHTIHVQSPTIQVIRSQLIMYRRRNSLALLASVFTIAMAACDSATQPREPLTSELGVVVTSRDRVLTAFVADTPSRKFTVGLGPDGSPVTVAVRGALAAVPLGTVNAVTVVNLREQRVTQTIALPTGSGASGAAFINDSIVLIGNPNLNTVTPVNVLRGTRGTDVPVVRFPQSIISVGDTAYVLNAELGSDFEPVGPGTLTVLVGYPSRNAGTIRLTGFNPGAAAMRADGTLAVVNSGRFGVSDGSISIVNRRTLAETQLIAGAGDFPGAIAVDGSGRVVVGAFGYGLAVYDPARSAFTRGPADAVKPGGIAGSSGVGVDSQGRLYALKPDCRNPSSVFRLTQTFEMDVEIPVGICPIAIAFTRVERTP